MKAGFALTLMVLGHPVHGPAQGIAEGDGNPGKGAMPAARIELPRLGRQVDAVESEGILAYGLIPPRGNIIQDGMHDPPGLGVGPGEPREERLDCLERRNGDAADQRLPSLGKGLATRL